MESRTRFSPCTLKSIVNNIADNREKVAEILDDRQVDTMLSLIADCIASRDRMRAKWLVDARGCGMALMRCSKCKSVVGARPTPYCPACGAKMVNGYDAKE